ncbi:hypothetical protein [Sphingobium sp.]|uniref:hypothetical protein n=1 Tax=Sphingobium sp. TaxID=1912891 RepID=UPI002BC5C935|nr:hypothetical protein [Sphingobium sp.]HUD95099.1 hypothetical protein [Sphingobium sp.]
MDELNQQHGGMLLGGPSSLTIPSWGGCIIDYNMALWDEPSAQEGELFIWPH